MPKMNITPIASHDSVVPIAKSASGLSFGPIKGASNNPNENKMSEILIANIILEYGEARPFSGSERIIKTMNNEARQDMPALMHLMIWAALRLAVLMIQN
jgi:hypothetical protein